MFVLCTIYINVQFYLNIKYLIFSESALCDNPDHNKRLCIPVTNSNEVNPDGLGVAFLKEMRKNVDKVAQVTFHNIILNIARILFYCITKYFSD